ncbi:MAG: hypothetical protein CK425_05230 [Parachlamydia sp.]|nr:MAG: hypothetical protein CK425_05230 [Parachlamydia sp.]
MLHLEKKGSSPKIHVTARESRKFWNPTLVQAFLCALFLHIFPFTVFRIHSFVFKESTVIFPPSVVNIDYEKSGEEYLVSSAFNSEGKFAWLQPKFHEPYFPELAFPTPIRQTEYEKVQDLQINPFTSFQNEFSFDKLLNPSLAQSDFPIQIKEIEGMLKVSPTAFEIENPGLTMAASGLFTFQVYVNASTSQLVGWQLIKGNGGDEKVLASLVKKILSQLTFTSKKFDHSFLHVGVIELTLNPFDVSMPKIWCRCD